MRMQVQSLALLSALRIRCCCELWYRLQTQLGSGFAVSCGIGCRHSSDPALLWCRLAATAPIRPLAWKTKYPYAKRQKKKKKNVMMKVE